MLMSDAAGYEIFAVTADKGIRAWGRTLPELFVHAACGLRSLMVDAGEACADRMFPVSLQAEDREVLLVAWLNELLYLYEVEKFVAVRLMVTDLSDTRLEAEVWGETVNPNRHIIISHVKAVTYHQLRMRAIENGWEAQMVVDV